MEENKKPENPYVHAMCDDNGFTQYGITLRDHFAGLAMQAMLSNKSMYDAITPNGWDNLSNESYLVADAMLKQREL